MDIRLQNISKSFGNDTVLEDISLHIKNGESVGIIGGNGSGKSTLAKIISGTLSPDSGKIFFNDELVKNSPNLAISKGITMLYQKPSLCPDLTVSENIFLTTKKKKSFLRFTPLHKKKLSLLAKQILLKITNDTISPDTLVQGLSGGQKKAVALAKIIYLDSPVIIMDEPTAALGKKQQESLWNIIERLRANHTLLYITHEVKDLFKVADRIIMLRNGKIILDTSSDLISHYSVNKLLHYAV